jgi:bifunctional DNA-binding transcriptional regulator/antitoxin component of YhaV-PrlF toxin-antitoxin module
VNEDDEKQRGFPSWRRICFIRLDSKARLVLPLEIRDILGIRPGGKILVRVGYAPGRAEMKISNGNGIGSGTVLSRNCASLKAKRKGGDGIADF